MDEIATRVARLIGSCSWRFRSSSLHLSHRQLGGKIAVRLDLQVRRVRGAIKGHLASQVRLVPKAGRARSVHQDQRGRKAPKDRLALARHPKARKVNPVRKGSQDPRVRGDRRVRRVSEVRQVSPEPPGSVVPQGRRSIRSRLS